MLQACRKYDIRSSERRLGNVELSSCCYLEAAFDLLFLVPEFCWLTAGAEVGQWSRADPFKK